MYVYIYCRVCVHIKFSRVQCEVQSRLKLLFSGFYHVYITLRNIYIYIHVVHRILSYSCFVEKYKNCLTRMREHKYVERLQYSKIQK